MQAASASGGGGRLVTARSPSTGQSGGRRGGAEGSRSRSPCGSHRHGPNCKSASPSLTWNVHQGLSLSCRAVAEAVAAGPPGVGASPEALAPHVQARQDEGGAGTRVPGSLEPRGPVSFLSLFMPWLRPQGPRGHPGTPPTGRTRGNAPLAVPDCARTHVCTDTHLFPVSKAQARRKPGRGAAPSFAR